MSLSAQKATTNISFFYNLVAEWESSNSVTASSQLFTRPPPAPGGEREGKDVIVAFRTRPPLDREFARFDKEKAEVGVQAEVDDGKEAAPQVDEKLLKEAYKPGISVISAEPGVMVAHVPGMKVSSPPPALCPVDNIRMQWSGPTLTQKKFTADLAFGPSISNEEVYQRTVIAQDVGTSPQTPYHY